MLGFSGTARASRGSGSVWMTTVPGLMPNRSTHSEPRRHGRSSLPRARSGIAEARHVPFSPKWPARATAARPGAECAAIEHDAPSSGAETTRRVSTMKIQLKPVRDQVIVITGATSGIGLATAKQAAKRGASVVLNARAEEDLEIVASEINDLGGQVAYSAGDVADIEVVRSLAKTAIRE